MPPATLESSRVSAQTEAPRYLATIQLAIDEFVPMSGVYGKSPSIVATISPPKDISPPPEPATPVFSGDGQSITITVPKGFTGRVALIYQLPDPRYVLLGAAFKSPTHGVGEMQFPEIDLAHQPNGSQMTVIDSCLPIWDKTNFSYVILVQEVGTANIGLIDPEVETQTEE